LPHGVRTDLDLQSKGFRDADALYADERDGDFAEDFGSDGHAYGPDDHADGLQLHGPDPELRGDGDDREHPQFHEPLACGHELQLRLDNSSNPVTATITLTVASASLFPGATFLTSTFTGITAVYAFSGANPTGALSVTIGGFSLAIGEALKLNATNIAITPSATQIASIGAVTVTSPKISGLTGTLTGGMAITQTGFSFTNLTLGYTGTATIGSILSFTNPSLAVTSFSYDSTNSSNPVTATITLTVASASLFPGATFLTSTFTGITAVYAFSGANPTGALSVTIGGSVWPLARH